MIYFQVIYACCIIIYSTGVSSLDRRQFISQTASSNLLRYKNLDEDLDDQGIWESANTRKNINGNSCKNLGTLFYNDIANRYKCVCEPGYEGANCQLRSHIGKEENTTCLKYNNDFDDCVPIQGNGFACYYKNDRERWCNFKNENSCPPGWTCLDNLIGPKRGYRCLPPGELKSLTTSEMFNDLWIPQCQNGGRLNESGICVCLKSSTGPYCELIDHCKNNPCSGGSTCHSFPAGYVCTCPDHRTGVDCKIIKRRIISIMKDVRLFHHSEQYILIPSTFLYLVRNPGFLPKISIDFSDKQVIEMTQEDFYRIENINDHLINLKFQPIEDNDLVAYAINFTHTYSNEGIYNMSFRAWNNNLLIFNSVFPIRVSDPANCTFELNLKNSVQSPDKAILYHRRDTIDIYASTRVSCLETSLNYHWELFSVPSIFSAPATEFKRTPQNISVHNAEYHAPPHTLTQGNYVLVLSVNMVQPISGGLINATTWFQIVKDKIVAHVSGGSFWNVHETEPFEISAFESYHPDLPRESPLNFSWFCSVKNAEHIATDFCGINDFKIISTRPVLHVQDHVLRLGIIYDFMVKVESDTAESAMQNVKIQVVPEDVELIRINCIQNCKGNMVAVSRPLILQALPKIKSKNVKLKWDCMRDDHPNLSILRTEDFVVDDDMFIVKARVFRESHRYKITVTAGYTNNTRKNGMAIFSFVTVSKFVAGICSIFPEQGFALFTQFDITCNYFLSKNAPIIYEAFQYMLPSQEPLLISFNVYPEFSNITLATGLPEMEYITRVVIYATDSTGLMESYVINVTVYPTAAYLGVISEIKLIKTLITSMASMTARYIVEADFHAVISNVWTILRAISTMIQRPLNDDDEIFINHHKNILVEYLSRCKYFNSISMKYAISALRLLIEIQQKYNYHRNSDKVQLIFNQILNDPLLYNVSRNDLIDIGVSILSASHSLIEKSISEESVWSHQASIDNLKKYSNLLSHSIVPHESIQMTNFDENLWLLLRRSSPDMWWIGQNHQIIANVSVSDRFQWLNEFLDVEAIIFTPDPSRRTLGKLEETKLPVATINTYTSIKDRRISAKGVIANADLQFSLKSKNHQTIKRSVRVKPSWYYTNDDISLTRLEVQPSGRLVIIFDDQNDNVILRVIVTKSYAPVMEDFFESETIPRYRDQNLTTMKKWTIYRDIDDDDNNDEVEDTDNKKNGSVFFYIGVLPHQVTLRSLMPNLDPSIPDDFLDEKLSKIQRYRRNIEYVFRVFTVHCLRWNETRKQWSPHCRIMDDVTDSSMTCRCQGLSTITATYRAVVNTAYSHSKIPMFTQFVENELIIWFIAYLLLCFFALYLWASKWDHWEKNQRKVIMLPDNDQSHSYSYILKLYTGSNEDAATSSKVAVMLEGSLGNSNVHVLESLARPVTTCGGRDHFLIKTKSSLGDVYRLNVWHNHRGPRPIWYVDKIIIHDVQTHVVSFFLIKSWLSPLHGDGSIGYTCYRLMNFENFPWRMRYSNALHEITCTGHHMLFGMFTSRHSVRYNSRRKLVISTVTYCLIIMACITEFYPKPQNGNNEMDSARELKLESLEIIISILASLISFPVGCALHWIFRNVAPIQSYASNYSSRYVQEIVIPKPMKLDDLQRNDLIGQFSSKQQLLVNNMYMSIDNPVIQNHVVPLNYLDDTESNEIYEKMISKTRPIHGIQRVRLAYIFPHAFFYPVCALYLMISIISLYFTLTRGSWYSWNTARRYLISCWIALLFSFLILETLKVRILALWKILRDNHLYVFEDRSHIVIYVTRKLIAMMRDRQENLSAIRSSSIYKPIPRERVDDLKRGFIKSFIAKVFQTEIIAAIVFLICLIIIQGNIYNRRSYYHYRNLDLLINGHFNHNQMSLVKVNYMEDFISYLETTVLQSIYHENDASGNIVITSDGVNHLVGSSRIRQIRIHPDSCLKDPLKDLHVDCKYVNIHYDMDKRNFSESWKEEISTPGPSDREQIWAYQDIITDEYLAMGNESSYPRGGYIVSLGRDKSTALAEFDYIKESKWIDKFTRAVIFETSLFNPNTKVASTIRILGEKCYNGGFVAKQNIHFAKVRSIDEQQEVILLLMMIILFLSTFLYVQKKQTEYAKSSWRHSFHIWDLLWIFLIITVIVVILTYIFRMSKLFESIEKLKMSDTKRYVYFDDIVWAESVFLTIISISLIMTIIKIGGIITTKWRIFLLWKTITRSLGLIMSGTLIILITLMSFGSLTFLIFGTHSWTYHNFHWATTSLFKILPNSMDLTYLPAWNTWALLHLTMPIISGIIALALLILRYLIFSIILTSYDALRFQTGVKKDIRDFLKDRTLKRYFEIGSSKPDLRMFEKSDLDSQRYHIIIRLLKNAVNTQDNEARQQAMGHLLLYNLNKKAELKNLKSSETEMTNQLKNDFLMINSLRAALRLQTF